MATLYVEDDGPTETVMSKAVDENLNKWKRCAGGLAVALLAVVDEGAGQRELQEALRAVGYWQRLVFEDMRKQQQGAP